MISDGINLLVRLDPAPVVARVATLAATIRPDPAAWLAREVSVVGFLAGRGAPVVPPSDELPPGPHERDGFAMSLWRSVDHDPAVVPEAGEVGRMLAGLHRDLAAYPGELPFMPNLLEDTANSIEVLERGRAISAGDATALRNGLEQVKRWLSGLSGPVQAIHGDPHPENMVVTADGPLWIDFEDTCAGPVTWDIASLANSTRVAGDAALAAYGYTPEPGELEPFIRARLLSIAVWMALAGTRFPQYADDGRTRVRAWLERYG